MKATAQTLDRVFGKPLDKPVYYFYSTEEYLVRQAAQRAIGLLAAAEGEEATVLPGPVPALEEIVAAAGTISLFGTRRIVSLPLLQPGSYGDKELAALLDILESTENAVFVITSVFADEKAMKGKRAVRLADEADRLGVSALLAKPTPADACRFIQKRAQALGTAVEPGADRELLDRCGQDLFLLDNEMDKLAALSGYTTITREMVSRLGTRSIEADVFDMVNLVQRGRTAEAFCRLEQLLLLQNEPVAIAAALAGSYVDIYRVKLGMKAGKSYQAVHKEFGYKGSDWRLKKAGETGSRISLARLEEILDILLELDSALKRSPADKTVLLQAALARIIHTEGKR